MILPLFLGSEETLTCNITGLEPVINYLEQRLVEKSGFLIDEASANGLFNLIQQRTRALYKYYA